ncbi:MAG: NHL repeat-containing protein [Candidatus Oleimicrobiaceae bacterium]
MKRTTVIAGVGVAVVALALLAVGRYALRGRGERVEVINIDKAPLYPLTYRPLFPEAVQGKDSSDVFSLYGLRGINVDQQGHIYVADSENNRVMKYDSTGRFLQQIGRAGQGPGELLYPAAVAFDEEGFIYVINAHNSRIEIYSPEGQYHSSFQIVPSSQFSFTDKRIGVGRGGQVFLNLPESGYLVTVFSRTGEKLREFGALRPYGAPHERPLFNRVVIACDDTRGVVHLVFKAFPLVQQYTYDGQLLLSREVDGARIREGYDDWERNRKKAKPGTVSRGCFFYSATLLPDHSLLASLPGLVHPVLCQFSPDGHIVRRLFVSSSVESSLHTIAAFRDGTIVFGTYFGQVGILREKR